MRSRIVLASVFLSAAVMGGCGGDGEPSSVVTETPTVTESAPTPAPTLSPEEASAIARRRYPGGTVGEVEPFQPDGLAVWKIEIRTARGAKRTVWVAIDSGKIVNTQPE